MRVASTVRRPPGLSGRMPKLYREHIVQEHSGSINLVERLEAAGARVIAMRREEDEKKSGWVSARLRDWRTLFASEF
jgi:hypothetical protein